MVAKQPQEDNAFDNLGTPNADELSVDEILKTQTDALHVARDYQELVHLVFKQNRNGKRLLGIWTDKLLAQGVFKNTLDPIDAAINEGEHRFVRNIIKAVKNVSENKL